MPSRITVHTAAIVMLYLLEFFQFVVVTTFTGKCLLLYGPGHAKMCLMTYANNKGADQPAHPHSLISTFIVRCLDSIICILGLSKVSRF